MVVFLVGKDTLKISEAYINAFPAFSCPLFASKNPIVPGGKFKQGSIIQKRKSFRVSGLRIVLLLCHHTL